MSGGLDDLNRRERSTRLTILYGNVKGKRRRYVAICIEKLTDIGGTPLAYAKGNTEGTYAHTTRRDYMLATSMR